MNTPVVFLVFNRPDTTRRVFERIRQARPPKLLVVCDGPRPHVPADAARVAEVCAIIAQGVDWPCEVLTHYAEKNLGCRVRVSSGLDWAFSLVEEAIIIEDDCLPDPSFFTFCETMLARYREDERVMHINGTNFLAAHLRVSSDFFFSKYVWVWGWATWRRAWRQYDPTMASWDERLPRLEESFDAGADRAFWLSTFEQARADWQKTNTWDFQWVYTCWTLGALTAMPSVNLVENLGIGGDSTHTTGDAAHLHLAAGSLVADTAPRRMARSRWRDYLMFCAYQRKPLDWPSRIAGLLRVASHQILRLARKRKTV